MDSAASLDKKIAAYMEQLNVKQKKAILSVAKAFAEESIATDMWKDSSFVTEMDSRMHELESGQVRGYHWDEVKEITRKSLFKFK